jgi:hypothetical protein
MFAKALRNVREGTAEKAEREGTFRSLARNLLLGATSLRARVSPGSPTLRRVDVGHGVLHKSVGRSVPHRRKTRSSITPTQDLFGVHPHTIRSFADTN